MRDRPRDMESKMRDRLRDMIAEIVTSADDTRTLEDVIADELIAKGVIALPFNIGQEAFVVDVREDREPEVVCVTVTEIGCNHYGWWITARPPFVFVTEEALYKWNAGKKLYRTREEAEKALAEVSKNGT